MNYGRSALQETSGTLLIAHYTTQARARVGKERTPAYFSATRDARQANPASQSRAALSILLQQLRGPHGELALSSRAIAMFMFYR